ncbi:hypothetical protein M9H77_26194 [Catharanthus roseus]|uniref:Uncharacterized protein n=1 Tax=Catharanthus roseus TaxID=4058 RepID=A0ACC0A9F5_CATRO|nr:hypothetical protein M9H77_26194 [Catharanthus roseus]
MNTEVLSVDAHSVRHFINELSPIVVLSPLLVESKINFSMQDIDEGIEECSKGEHNTEGKGSSGLDLEVVGSPAYGQFYVSGHVIDFFLANIAHYLSCPRFSDIEGIGMEEEIDFDDVTKVLIRDTGAVWPETNKLNSNLIKMTYRALLRERVHLLYTFATRKGINIRTIIFKNILRLIDQKKANKIALPCPCLISNYLLGCMDLSLPSWVRALNPLVMPKIVAPSVVPPSPTPSILGHTGPGKSTRFLIKHEGLCSSLVFDLKNVKGEVCRNLSYSLSVATQVGHKMAQSFEFLAAPFIDIVFGNLIDLEESVIMSYNFEVQLRRFKSIRKGQDPK